MLINVFDKVIKRDNILVKVMLKKITNHEIFQAEIALLAAIALQFVVWNVQNGLSNSQMVIIVTELAMVVIVSLSSRMKTGHSRSLHRLAAVVLLGLLSVANIGSLVVILGSLVTGDSLLSGLHLLSSALAIFATNIIVFALWYWEIDSPGLTQANWWSKNDKDFQFTQQTLRKEFSGWSPQFVDYMYLSVTNAINFAPADTKPLTRNAKMLMATQALISLFTLAIVIARSVSILGS